MIKVGKCFSISNGVLKNKNAQYNKTGADYELTLGRSSIIEPCVDSIDGLVRKMNMICSILYAAYNHITDMISVYYF